MLYAEIVGLVALMAGVNLTFFARDPGFVGVRPHPMLFVAVVVAARYGFAAGAFAAAACAAEYAAMFLLVARRPLYELFAGANAAPLVVLVPTTVFVGMLVQHHLDRRRRADEEAERARRLAHEATEQMASLRDINLELGDRIINAQSTRLLLLDQLKPLLAADEATLFGAFAAVLADVLRAESAAVWRPANGRPLHLVAHAGQAPRPLPFDVERHFRDRDVIAAHDAPDDAHALPLLLGRLRARRGGAVIAFVSVDGIPLQAAPDADELFAALVAWFSAAAERVQALGAAPLPKSGTA